MKYHISLAVDQVVEPSMTLGSVWMFLARQRMLAEGIHRSTAGAGVGLANCTTQAETDGHAYGVVIEVETRSADRKSVEPVSAVRCCRRQQSGLILRLAVTTQQVIVLSVDDNVVPDFLFVSHGVLPAVVFH